ncbi:hypothetical protein DYB37_005730 [Aphanomyces astaci]|uniref:Uncharacterized protein n=1 Tax=Aphanomyces astaci TaxID=112090 RepID=A0A3R6WQ03_APHAT|nr:hypothetical protein DYB35_009568 [Aphanomyces astaci]RHZ18741.1 hypothetical protein DYB37_005730 [Aphanomyces astaci]
MCRLFFFYLVTDLGIPYFYTCVGNLVVAAALQHSINAKRPIDYDDSLYIHACTDPDTTGFPSIDSHMAIVVITPALTSNSVSALTMPSTISRIVVVCFVVGAVCCVASWVEASDSRNFGIPRHEFTRVLKAIVGSGTDDVAVAASLSEGVDQESRRRDSFYYLMQSVHSRRRNETAVAPPPQPVQFHKAVGNEATTEDE